MSQNECRFYPVQCSDETFKGLAPAEGHVYFVTDTKKIFLGKNGKMIPMCATSGFFYGIKEIEYENTGLLPDPNVRFLFDEIEGEDIPEEDDLILNKDGCFYRVKEVADDGLETVRLTLQGTGTGGGGGGTGGGGTTGADFSINVSNTWIYASTATEMPFIFRANSTSTDENYVIDYIELKIKGSEDPFCVVEGPMKFNENITIDLYPYRNLFNANKTGIELHVYDIMGNPRSATKPTVQVVNVSLIKKRDDLIIAAEDTYTYVCNFNVPSAAQEPYITYTFYDERGNHIKDADQRFDIENRVTTEAQKTLNVSKLTHGVYTLKVQAFAKINASTILTSNILTHKFARFINEASPLLMINVPEVTEQYTNIPVQYMVVTKADTSKNYMVKFAVPEASINAELTATSNTIQSYNLYFEKRGVFRLSVSVVGLNLSNQVDLDIKPYTGDLPVIDGTSDNLMLYLNPRGKSNDAVNRNTWTDEKNNHVANIVGLHYGETNGWLVDDDGISHLKLSAGANLSMPNFRPFEKDLAAAQGMTIELDLEVNGVLNYNTEILKCLSRDNDNHPIIGFSLTGNSVNFYGQSDTPLISLSLVEGKRIRYSFVIEPRNVNFPMIYGYVNGKITAVCPYTTTKFTDFIDRPAYLFANSTDAQIKIYGIRIYSSALNDIMILNNYTASLPTLEERQARYESNNVYYDDGSGIDYEKVMAADYNLQIPCMFLTGGYANEKDDKWRRKSSSDTSARLPIGKKDYRAVDVKVVYPKEGDLSKYSDYQFINIYGGNKSMAEAYGEKPSNGGAIMYAQGTSSMEYPVKNLRLRFKSKDDWYTVKDDIEPVEIICMKADFMESSGSHNTGSANLIDSLYISSKYKTPAQKALEGEGKPKVVTAIKGYPCLIFFSTTGEPGSYKFVGKYNLNLDKATPKPFGFTHDKENLPDFGYLKEGDEYYEIRYGNKDEDYADEFIGQEEPDEGADYIPGQDEENAKTTVGVGEKINSIHCFEFLDNNIDVCNFLGMQVKVEATDLTEEQFNNNADEKYYVKGNDGKYKVASKIFDSSLTYYVNSRLSYKDTWYNTFTNTDGDEVPGWTLGFESRYPEDRIGYHDADMLYPLASWLNELYLLYNEGDENHKKLALARFKHEYQNYLNKDFLMVYYVYTEALLMADSRVKNMMIATWGKENYALKEDEAHTLYENYIYNSEKDIYEPDKSGNKTITNNYIFYPIFYDMDTMLGLNNEGAVKFAYYDEDTNPSTYNGEEILWNFVRLALQPEIRTYFSKLEGAGLTKSNVLKYFTEDQAEVANEAFYNNDAKYKYLRPYRDGYINDSTGKPVAAGTASFLYAVQGDRSLMREQFVTDRFRFLSGKYTSPTFIDNDKIEYRLYYPSGTEKEFNVEALDGKDHSNSTSVVKPDGAFEFTALKVGYSGVQIGMNTTEYNVARFDNIEGMTQKIVASTDNANGTEGYVLGLSNLSDLGDLSNKYMAKFIIKSDDVRLKKLTLGNPHRDYYNPYWRTEENVTASEIGLGNATYLEEFNLQNCWTYNAGLNFSACPAIRKVLLTGSSVSSVILPPNGMLEELRLPNTVTSLAINSHTGLTNDKFSIGGYEYSADDPRIGFGGKYINDFSRLISIDVINTPINTYEMVINANNLNSYRLQGINWAITENDTQYCFVSRNDATLTPEKIRTLYYYDSISKTHELWGQDTYPMDIALYEKYTMLDNDNKVICIPALEYLKTREAIGIKSDALTGTITIDIPGATVVELDIYNKYIEMYPNVKIQYGSNMGEIEGANRINFYAIEYSSELDVSQLDPMFSVLTANQEKTLAQLIDSPEFIAPSKTPTQTTQYTFYGLWTDMKTGKTYFQDDGNYTLTEGSDAIPFSTFRPTDDMDLVPHFGVSDRLYNIVCYSHDGVELYPLFGKYGWTIMQTARSYGETWYPPRLKYTYRANDNAIQPHERYVLKGWISEADYKNGVQNPTLIDLETYQVTDDINIYAYYGVEDCRKTPSMMDLFIITDCEIVMQGHAINGKQIELNPLYNNLIMGAITIPTYDTEGNPIVAIKKLHLETKDTNGVVDVAEWISEVYFLEDSQCICFGNEACLNMTKLETIHFPPHMQYFGDRAFSQTHQLKIANLPVILKIIGNAAFFRGGSSTSGNMSGITISELPDTVEYIGDQAFMYCENVGISSFGGETSALKTIGYMAFGYGGSNTVNSITINKNALLKSNSRNEYSTFLGGYDNVTNLYLYNDQTFDGIDDIAMNLFGRSSNITVHQTM